MEYIEPILAPAQNLEDPILFHNSALGFTHIRLHQRGEAPRVLSVWDVDEEALAPFIERPKNPWAVDFSILMGVVNVTPDSFSDGGQFLVGGSALAHARNLREEGAILLDFGAESTRPGAEEVPAAEEIDRLAPIFDGLGSLEEIISVDTRKSAVAAAAIDAGAHMINDVSALEFDPEMAEVVAGSSASLCLMHSQGTPDVMQDNPQYQDVLLDIYDYLAARIAYAEEAGIDRKRIVVDPGLGFGKTLDHNLAIIRHAAIFHGLGCPLLFGASRKSMIGKIDGGAPAEQRLGGSVAIALDLAAKGVQIIRVHDVSETKQALALARAINYGFEQ